MGDLNNNNLRSDIMEATKMAKLNFKVDAIFNYNGEIVDIFAGDPIKEHDEGVILAQKHYKTQKAKNMDIVIANACCKANEAGMVIKQVVDSLLKDGGILIIITNTPEGLAPHYVLGRWGLSKIGGCNWKEKIIPKSIKKLIVYTKYIDIGQSWWFGPRKEINWFKDWDKVVNFIDKDNKNVVIYPDATIQLIK
jgi:nickel-dependent lactate racemase